MHRLHVMYGHSQMRSQRRFPGNRLRNQRVGRISVCYPGILLRDVRPDENPLDRCNPLYNSDYKFKEVYLMTSAAENEESAMDGAVKGMEGWIECFPGVKLSGVLRGTGLEDPGEAARSEYVKQAYDMGKNI